ncbi:MAG: 50S ribosomal protein L17 [Chloroflexi bacterium]|nr:50S ribosomal protein L17 [Chloroflexota bacterium]MCH9038130.1 50S ribosomal protein L17 [Chloroflexota bacterium]MCI0790253.1 50S ribosomal protein L17 [Chloroflexota bacterium]
MRHKLSGRKLNRPTAHRMLMLRGMVADLIRHEAIRTTEAKAKEVRRMAEKVITRGKKGNLHNRRMALGLLSDESVVGKVFDELAQRYQDRPGGYTRVVKLGPRKGDAAPMAIVELLP